MMAPTPIAPSQPCLTYHPLRDTLQLGWEIPRRQTSKSQTWSGKELHMAHSSGKKHTWAMDVAGDGSGGGGGGGDRRRRLSLVWTRTRSVTVDGMTRPPLSTRNWKLTEISAAGDHVGREGDQPILAVFTTTTQMGKCGNLQVNVDYGREFDLMLFVTCLSLYSSGR